MQTSGFSQSLSPGSQCYFWALDSLLLLWFREWWDELNHQTSRPQSMINGQVPHVRTEGKPSSFPTSMLTVLSSRCSMQGSRQWKTPLVTSILPGHLVSMLPIPPPFHPTLCRAIVLQKIREGCEWEGVPLFSSMFVNKENVFLL